MRSNLVCLILCGAIVMPTFLFIQLMVMAFGLTSGILNIVLLGIYGIVWYYVYKVIGDSYVRKSGRK